MRRTVRHLLVLTLAFALVASAAAWRQCAALQMAAADAANSEHAPGHGEHDHHAMHQHAADEPAAPAADDHGCMKCCTMCTVATATLPTANAAVTFTISAHEFFQRPKAWSGNTIAVDPGIPKRTV
jgi:hypothetical protein